jgi:hypothetical protein
MELPSIEFHGDSEDESELAEQGDTPELALGGRKIVTPQPSSFDNVALGWGRILLILRSPYSASDNRFSSAIAAR